MNAKITLTTLAVLLTASGTAGAEGSWHYSLSPYMWLAGVEGESATVPPLPPAPIDISPSDAADDTDVSYMLTLTGKKGRHGWMADFLYTDVRSDEDFAPALGLSLESVSKNQMFTLAYSYELIQSDSAFLDAFAGARYWNVDTSLRFSGGQGLLAGRRIENSDDWIDPVFGIKGRTDIGASRFYLNGWAALGGLNVGADLLYELSLNLGYQWTDSIGTTVGYRFFDVDYEDDGFLYDIEQHGVMLGLTWQF
ncbi:MAG: hypothetical protein V2J89_03090 [Halieaceae bacterium]|jgi:hypothetical protein|nr:hypothetical protein [Halieaceae bacterium]